jgi:hypothetical protein
MINIFRVSLYSYICRVYLSCKNEIKLLEEGRVIFIDYNTDNEAFAILVLRITRFYYLLFRCSHFWLLRYKNSKMSLFRKSIWILSALNLKLFGAIIT